MSHLTMDDTEQNGLGNPRMDRIERTLEMLIADHVAFADEHKKLLTSQVLLTGTMQELAESQKATDGRMTILISKMDTFIRERGHKG